MWVYYFQADDPALDCDKSSYSGLRSRRTLSSPLRPGHVRCPLNLNVPLVSCNQLGVFFIVFLPIFPVKVMQYAHHPLAQQLDREA